ncbi:UDP-3-O-(3-hydroxymyristoyl)glucosamine N-acyltransferase [Allosphingosinicella flava]|uniref:UDP-3-O-(3-hydroxymyristoyl)glucosamine N-acyltransferase n=1 Tax=Allosphingosinicella flava TaxID=2771430 RepID=A0A7T2LLG9_9SPHN|nr:UDP-3-O-(3-hydroxymyristoyl)glucosamine N-acyltransferase [Sphingosinicella flava]QPQ54429.1 UDP-3-O-(3-hydroxymyristoyl)glucosamine N-acyltransferase [Sphingosinicella flava]
MAPEGAPTALDIRDATTTDGAIRGDSLRRSFEVAPLHSLREGQLGFLSRLPADDALADLVTRTSAATIICNEKIASSWPEASETTLIVAQNPRLSFMRAVGRFFSQKDWERGIHPTATVDGSAKIDPSAAIGAHCVIGPGCVVGADTRVHPHVVLVADVKVGRRVTIAGGTVIGADGFGYERNEHGELEKFPHIGGVVIDDDVEIGSNTSIDRGTLEATWIKARARIDNQVHIAHNVVVGMDVAIIAQSMIGGGVRIGDRAWIAPSATIINQVAIGKDAVVGLGAVVVKSVEDGATVMGSPAQPDAEFRQVRAALKKLVSHAD